MMRRSILSKLNYNKIKNEKTKLIEVGEKWIFWNLFLPEVELFDHVFSVFGAINKEIKRLSSWIIVDFLIFIIIDGMIDTQTL